jgi:hypothetical protein
VSYITSASGDEIWSAAYGSVDVLTGEIEGEWFTLGGTGRFEGATGAGQIVAARGPDGWLTDFEATGRISTVGSGKRRCSISCGTSHVTCGAPIRAIP